MRVLNLYTGLGGNRKQWQDVEVTAVEMEPDISKVYASQFPDDVLIVGDAHQYLKSHYENFDFVWSSPPCQKHSRMMKATRHKVADYPGMNLYAQIIFLRHFFKGKWVVENVKPYYEPLIKPTQVLGRHYFWSNFDIPPVKVGNMAGFITAESPAAVQQLKDWLGIQYKGNIYYKNNHSPAQVLRNCVHPSIGKHIIDAAFREPVNLFSS